ncbi:hypothetical protein Tco_0020211 [Tanacetum coccineum]
MPHDLPLPRVHTLGSDEGRMQPNELMELVIKLSDRVAVLENDFKQTKKTYGAAFTKLIKKGRKIAKIDEDPNISLVYTAEPYISTANVPVSTAGAEVSTAAESLTKTKIQQEQERLGFEEAQRLQEQFDKEKRQRIASVHEEASTFKPEEWDNIQAQIEANEELAHRLQAQEREGYSEADKAKLLLRGYSFDEIKVLFEATVKRVNTFTPMESDDTVPRVVAGSSKRSAEEELDELSQEQLQQLIIIVPEEGINVDALQTKYPIIDWEVYTKDLRKYWKIIKVGDHTEVYQFFEDMLKNFNRDDLVKLWDLVRERFSSTEPTYDKERALWVELKRLFEPDTDDLLEL